MSTFLGLEQESLSIVSYLDPRSPRDLDGLSGLSSGRVFQTVTKLKIFKNRTTFTDLLLISEKT